MTTLTNREVLAAYNAAMSLSKRAAPATAPRAPGAIRRLIRALKPVAEGVLDDQFGRVGEELGSLREEYGERDDEGKALPPRLTGTRILYDVREECREEHAAKLRTLMDAPVEVEVWVKASDLAGFEHTTDETMPLDKLIVDDLFAGYD
jgi:hypothetical protein